LLRRRPSSTVWSWPCASALFSRPLARRSSPVFPEPDVVTLRYVAVSVTVAALWQGTTSAPPGPVSIHVDATRSLGPMTPFWRFFGYDEPNYTYMNDGRKLLSELSALSPVPVYIRTHNLLTTGDGTPSLKWGSTNAYTASVDGRVRYDWTIVDRIF